MSRESATQQERMSEQDLKVWEGIIKCINGGEYRKLQGFLEATKILSPQTLETVFRYNISEGRQGFKGFRSYPLAHYSLTVGNKSEILEGLLIQKLIGDIIMSFDVEKNRKDHRGRTYYDLLKITYEDRITIDLTNLIKGRKIQNTADFLKSIEYYDPDFIEELLQKNLRVLGSDNPSEEELAKYPVYPILHYCFSGEKTNNVNKFLNQDKVAQLLLTKYEGKVNPDQPDYAGRNFKRYREQRFLEVTSQIIVRGDTESLGKIVDHLIENKNLSLLDFILENAAKKITAETPHKEEKEKFLKETRTKIESAILKRKSPTIKRVSWGDGGITVPKPAKKTEEGELQTPPSPLRSSISAASASTKSPSPTQRPSSVTGDPKIGFHPQEKNGQEK